MSNKLEFGKIRFRALEPDDIELLFQWENNTEIWELSNTSEPFSKHSLARYINESRHDIYTSKQLRLIIENTDNKAVGAIDLFDFDPFHLRAGVGILIHDTIDREQGYATDALQLLCSYTREYFRLHQLYANIVADNLASINLFMKVGFELAGTKKEWHKTTDGWKDELTFQKLL